MVGWQSGGPEGVATRWRPVIGYEDGYEVSEIGQARKVVTGHILRHGKTGKGHLAVKLRTGGVGRNIQLARVVPAAFLGPIPPGWMVSY